jgi:hypothetical protein
MKSMRKIMTKMMMNDQMRSRSGGAFPTPES